jgi:glycosyltransferase involved in cell wall biosynthesis
MAPGSAPSISIIVIMYDMAREASRTLQSLTAGYQLGGEELDYEVLVVDNGSPEPLDQEMVESFGEQFSLIRINQASPSPVSAINWAAAGSRGDLTGVLIDGARILTPGVLQQVVRASRLDPNPIIATLGWHLGPDVQSKSSANGYTREIEDGLLDEIGWPAEGYRLFEVSALAGSSSDGWFWPMAESNCLFLPRETFARLGGYDERFQGPGGGLANLDFYRRACELSDSTMVMILGEGSFHQLHGGVTTGGDGDEGVPPSAFEGFHPEYTRIRGCDFRRPHGPIEFVGRVPAEALPSLMSSARHARELLETEPDGETIFGQPAGDDSTSTP